VATLRREARAAIAKQLRPFRAVMRTNGDPRLLGIVFRSTRGVRYPETSNQEHLHAAMTWLCAAQDATGSGGVSAYYDLGRGGWVPAYPETTGYIIPTFFDYAAYTRDDRYRERALRMADWLLTVQHTDGSFPIGPLWPHWRREPVVFDTGQVLQGLVRAFQETARPSYLAAARRAGDWLVAVQEADGSFRRFEYRGLVHTYTARVAWALLQLHEIHPEASYRTAAIRHLEWCHDEQQTDGWFTNASFTPDSDPLTHTIAYTVRGLLEGGLLLSDESMIDSARRAADQLKSRQSEDGRLAGTFGPGWNSNVRWSCLTGNVQLAQIWLRLFELTGDPTYQDAARRAISFVKQTQIRDAGVPGVDGGIAGSYPIHGDYQSFQIVNWAAKFFVDSLLLEEAIRKRPSGPEMSKAARGPSVE